MGRGGVGRVAWDGLPWALEVGQTDAAAGLASQALPARLRACAVQSLAQKLPTSQQSHPTGVLQRHSPLTRTVTPWSHDTRCSSFVSLTYTAKSGTDAPWPPRAALSASSSSTVAAAAPLPLLPLPLRARDSAPREPVGATSNAADPPLLM